MTPSMAQLFVSQGEPIGTPPAVRGTDSPLKFIIFANAFNYNFSPYPIHPEMFTN